MKSFNRLFHALLSLGVVQPAFSQTVTTVEFSALVYFAPEKAGLALIAVRRSGDVSREFNVDCLTIDETAIAGSDYIEQKGTLRFAAGETNKTFTVPILDDHIREQNETLHLVLSNPTSGVVLGGRGSATLTIWNDDGNGSLDPDFDPGSGANDSIQSILLQPDGKILIGGFFTSVAGTNRNRIARLHQDGSLDSSFDPGSGAEYFVGSMALQTGGKILIGGGFTNFNGAGLNRIARLNPDGSLDSSFNPGAGANDWVDAIAVQADGTVVIGGRFTRFNGTARNHLARLKSDGSLDTAFGAATGANTVAVLAALSDGRILIGGDFDSVNGASRAQIARLNADGTSDAAFTAALAPGRMTRALAIQADGRIVIGGDFIRAGPSSWNFLARLNPDGSFDDTFNRENGVSDKVDALAIQPDGRILIVGNFAAINSVPRGGIARLNPDGSLDMSFDPDLGADDRVLAVALQTDDKVVIGGRFSLVNDVPRNRVARLNGDVLQFSLSPLRLTGSGFELTLMAPSARPFVLEGSTNLVDWVSLTTNATTSPTFSFTDTNAANFNLRFYRARFRTLASGP